MSQGGGTGTSAINIWQMGQSAHLDNIEVYNAKAASFVIHGGSVPIVLRNLSSFGAATYGYDVNLNFDGDSSGNTFACYTCTGDDNVSGLFRFQNGGDRATVLVTGSKGEKKINVSEQDPLFTFDHYSGLAHIDSFEAFGVTGFAFANDVIKIVDTITPGTPLHPDITVTNLAIRRYHNVINDVANFRTVGAPAGCTSASPCLVPRLHYTAGAQYNFEDINGTVQSFGTSAGSFVFSHKVIGDAFSGMVYRPRSICMGDGSADPTSPQNCIQSSAGNAGIFTNKQFTAPSFQSNGASGTVPISFATRAMGVDPVTNVTIANHPTFFLSDGTAAQRTHYAWLWYALGGDGHHYPSWVSGLYKLRKLLLCALEYRYLD